MKSRQIYEFITLDGKSPVGDFICCLDAKLQHKIEFQLSRLCSKDCPLHPPLVKSFRMDKYKGFYELRTRIKQTMTRIIFYFDPGDNIVLLHGFLKKQERSTNQALETARARKKALAVSEAYVIERY